MNEQDGSQKEETGACGPGCNCGTTGFSSRTRWMVCGIVAAAAVVTAVVHVSRVEAAESQKKQQDYSSAIPVVAMTNAAKPQAAAAGWGVPLKSLAELNTVATNTDAVFVVVPSLDGERTAAIQKEVATAAATITGRGTKAGTFLLSRDAQEYAGLVQQTGVPVVLTMVKGGGMATVKDKEVTQDGLLKAYVAASRPSSCGGSGCGPSGCK